MIALTTIQAVELALLIGGYAMAVALLPRVIVARRESAATLSWILALLLIPYVGMLFYWIFGEVRLHRTTRRRRSTKRLLAQALADERERRRIAAASSPDPTDDDVVHLVARITGVPAVGGNAIQIFADPDVATERMIAAIDGATATIHFEVYQFKKDESGTLYRDHLAAAARRGVKVRLLVDDVGSLWTPRSFFRPIVEAGGEVERFLPVNLLRGLYHANLRNHRKILVVDGARAFTGGLNVGDEYGGLRKRRFGPWRDTHVELRGPVVASLQDTFVEDWVFATHREIAVEEAFPDLEPAGAEVVQVIASGPDSDWESIHHAIFAAVTGAQHHAYLTTPYFVPDRALLVAMQTAALRGVDVRVLMPERSDHFLVRAAGRYHYEELLRAGIRVYEFGKGMLHAKTLEIDHRCAMIGSANLDLRSFRLNFELNVAAYGSGVAAEVHSQFLRDLEDSREITRGVVARWSYGRRLLHATVRLLEGLL